MTDTISIAPDADQSAGNGTASGGLSAMRMPELKKVAHDIGLSGTSGMKKSDLIAAISAAQSGAAPASKDSSRRRGSSSGSKNRDAGSVADAGQQEPEPGQQASRSEVAGDTGGSDGADRVPWAERVRPSISELAMPASKKSWLLKK